MDDVALSDNNQLIIAMISTLLDIVYYLLLSYFTLFYITINLLTTYYYKLIIALFRQVNIKSIIYTESRLVENQGIPEIICVSLRNLEDNVLQAGDIKWWKKLKFQMFVSMVIIFRPNSISFLLSKRSFC